MKVTIITIPGSEIRDEDSFHDVLARELVLPAFYGRNLDALADCLLSVDEPDHGMVGRVIGKGELMLLQLNDAELVKQRCPRHYEALIEIVATENQRRVRAGGPPVLGLILVGDLL